MNSSQFSNQPNFNGQQTDSRGLGTRYTSQHDMNQKVYELQHSMLQVQPVPQECQISNLDFDEMVKQGVNYRLTQLEEKFAKHEAKFAELTAWDDSKLALFDEMKLADRLAMSIIRRNKEFKAHKAIVDWTKSLEAEVEKSDRFYVEVEWNY